jgi:hypothetical protein
MAPAFGFPPGQYSNPHYKTWDVLTPGFLLARFTELTRRLLKLKP